MEWTWLLQSFFFEFPFSCGGLGVNDYCIIQVFGGGRQLEAEKLVKGNVLQVAGWKRNLRKSRRVHK